jgi:hypothetical protein
VWAAGSLLFRKRQGENTKHRVRNSQTCHMLALLCPCMRIQPVSPENILVHVPVASLFLPPHLRTH